MISRDDLRVGDAERDRMADALREHYAQGRLTREELDQRLDQTFAARTAGELARVAHDLPDVAGERDVPSPGPPWIRGPGPYGPPWSPGHPAARHRRRHPRVPPAAPFVLLVVLVAVTAGFAGLKVLFFIWLGVMVIGGVRHHHRRHHRTRT